MPKIPDHIRERMNRRMDYRVEEIAGRRILRGLGVPGAAGKRLITAMRFIGMVGSEVSDWEAAKRLLRLYFSSQRNYKAGITEYHVIDAGEVKKPIEEAANELWQQDKSADIAVFFVAGDTVRVVHNSRSYTIKAYEVGVPLTAAVVDSNVFIIQSVEAFVNCEGSVMDEPTITNIIKEAEERGFTR